MAYNVLAALKTHGLPPALADARPKRLRFSVFTIPARIISHARRLYARVAERWVKRCELIASRLRVRALWDAELVARARAPAG